MRGTFGNFSKSIGALAAAAALTITSLLTFGTGATFQMNSGIQQAVLFLDANRQATTTAGFTVATTTGGGATILATGNFTSQSPTGQFVCNGINASCTLGQTNGTGGSLTVMSGGDSVFQTWNGSAFTNRITVEGNQANTEVTVSGYATATRFGADYYLATSTALNQGYRIANGTISGGISADTSYLYVGTQSNHSLRFYLNNGSIIDLSSTALFPSLTTDQISIGSNTARFRTLHSLNVSTTNVTSTRFDAPAGIAQLPSFNFAGAGEADTGMYSDFAGSVSLVADTLRLITARSNGVFLGSSSAAVQPFSDNSTDLGLLGNRFKTAFFYNVSSVSVTSTKVYAFNTGACTSPGYSFQNDTDTGIDTFTAGNSGVLHFCGDGSQRAYITYTGAGGSLAMVGNGAVISPSFTWASDPNTGFYNTVADSIFVTLGGSVGNEFNSTSTRVLGGSSVTSTLWVGALGGRRGQICVGDQDGTGATCITGNNGVVSAYSTSTY